MYYSWHFCFLNWNSNYLWMRLRQLLQQKNTVDEDRHASMPKLQTHLTFTLSRVSSAKLCVSWEEVFGIINFEVMNWRAQGIGMKNALDNTKLECVWL